MRKEYTTSFRRAWLGNLYELVLCCATILTKCRSMNAMSAHRSSQCPSSASYICHSSKTNSARAQYMILLDIRAFRKTDLSCKVGIRLTEWKARFCEKVSFEQSRTKERASYACCLGYHMLHVPSNATSNAQASLGMIPPLVQAVPRPILPPKPSTPPSRGWTTT